MHILGTSEEDGPDAGNSADLVQTMTAHLVSNWKNAFTKQSGPVFGEDGRLILQNTVESRAA